MLPVKDYVRQFRAKRDTEVTDFQEGPKEPPRSRDSNPWARVARHHRQWILSSPPMGRVEAEGIQIPKIFIRSRSQVNKNAPVKRGRKKDLVVLIIMRFWRPQTGRVTNLSCGTASLQVRYCVGKTAKAYKKASLDGHGSEINTL